jgi:hypothetical protein
MKTYLSVLIHKTKGDIIEEGATTVTLVDDGAGWFVEVSQDGCDKPLRFDPGELELVTEAANYLLGQDK